MIDKRMLPHTVSIEPVVGKDEFQKNIYGKPIIFKFVRFDFTKEYRGSGDNRELFSNGVVFFYKEHTTNFEKIDVNWYNAKILFNGSEYLVKDITPLTHWQNDSIWSIEMDVI